MDKLLTEREVLFYAIYYGNLPPSANAAQYWRKHELTSSEILRRIQAKVDDMDYLNQEDTSYLLRDLDDRLDDLEAHD